MSEVATGQSGGRRPVRPAPDGVESRVRQLDALLKAHAGGLELVDLSDGGVARIRFSGMCTGCPLKPLTLEATIRPHLIGVGGVTDVVAEGARLSEEASERLRSQLAVPAA